MPYYYYGYFYDYWYFLLALPVLILSLAAQIRVKSAFRKYARVLSGSNMTGQQAAMRVLQYYQVPGIQFQLAPGRLTDYFDPRREVIALSQDVMHGSSVAAIGVACHEAGHAAQHAEGYAPIKIRNSLLPVCKIGSMAALPIMIVGYMLAYTPLVWVGLFAYIAIALFQLATLPVEFNASRRALAVIEETGMLSDEERHGAKKVLSAAALTYVAALISTLLSILRIFLSTRRRR